MTGFSWRLAIWFLAMGIPGMLLGQDLPDLNRADNPKPLQRAVVLKRAEMQRFMEMHLEDLVRVCELTPEQNAKLRLASKGAVEKSVESWTDDIHANGWLNMVGQMDEEVVDQWLASMAGDTVPREVLKQPIWEGAISRVLTEPQKKLRDLDHLKRLAHRRKAVVEQAIVTLEMELLLSPEQREPMRKLLDEEMGKKMAERGQAPRMAQTFTKHLPRKKMAQILTEAQILRWDDLEKQASFSEYDEWSDIPAFAGQDVNIGIAF